MRSLYWSRRDRALQGAPRAKRTTPHIPLLRKIAACASIRFMDEGSGGNIVTELFSALWEVWKEMWAVSIEVLPKVISFVLWVLLAIVVLPCVYIAGVIYPMWVEWGEEM